MTTLQQRISTILAAALLIGLSGCATVSQEDFDRVMSMAQQAQQDAAAARQAANKAQSTADAAQRSAQSAQSAASAAQSAADAANSCCADNSEKLDRMFKQSMKK